MSYVHGPNNRFESKGSESRSQCFQLNIKLGQLKPTHRLGNIMLIDIGKITSIWKFRGHVTIWRANLCEVCGNLLNVKISPSRGNLFIK